MTLKWSIRDGVLDALKDDDESIIQILEYLNYLKINNNREMIKAELIKLLYDGCIKITYPYEVNVTEFENATNVSISDFWFGLTLKGENEWSTIENEC